MATITKQICDRCGKEIEYRGWTSKLKRPHRERHRTRILKILNGNPGGYSYTECDYELCAECTKKLIRFLEAEEN